MLLSVVMIVLTGETLLRNPRRLGYKTSYGMPEFAPEQSLRALVDGVQLAVNSESKDNKELIKETTEGLKKAQKATEAVDGSLSTASLYLNELEKAATAFKDPSTALKYGADKAGDLINGIFGRNLSLDVLASFNSGLSLVKNKTAEVKTQNTGIKDGLKSSMELVGVINDVISGNYSGLWNKFTGIFRKLEVVYSESAETPVNLIGRRRLSLYQQNERREVLKRRALKLRRLLSVMNGTMSCTTASRKLAPVLYDLAQEEGEMGQLYLTLTDSLDKVLSKQDCQDAYLRSSR